MFASHFDIFISALVSLFVIIDPLGTSVIFSALTKGDDKATMRKIATKAVLIAIVVLIVFCLIGQQLLHHMGISMAAFRITGGLLLFVTAFRMIMGYHDPDQMETQKPSVAKQDDIAVFPLAIPLLAGPGTITATLMFATSADSIAATGVVIVAVLIIQFLALISLILSPQLMKIMGRTGNGILARIMGILLAAMSVQFIADGFVEIFFPS